MKEKVYLAISLLLLSFALPPYGEPTEPKPGGEIVFSSERDGDRDIYLINADGSNLRQLTNDEGEDGHPDWSPDGQKIVFFSKRSGYRQLYIVELDNHDIVIGSYRLTHSNANDHFPAWSPDGFWITFASERDGNSEIYITRPDGSGVRRITNNTTKDLAPNWSSDGTLLFYTATESNGYQSLRVIHTSDLKTESIPVSTRIGLNDTGYADYSPDNKHIIFHSRRNGRVQLFMMNVDGTNERQLFRSAKRDWIPVWSPDGEWIAFDSELRFSDGDITVMHLESGNKIKITRHPSSDWGPDWRPTSF